MTLTNNQLTALRILQAVSPVHFDPWDLAGPYQARLRAQLMTALNGKKTPQAKAGVTVIRRAFHDIAKPQGNCVAADDELFAEWAKKQLAA